jgi:hypothetical protein
MRRPILLLLAIATLIVSGCQTTGGWWPFRGGGAKSSGGTFKGVKQTWGMQAANIQVPRDLQDYSSD